MSFYDDASLIMFPSGYKEDKIYSLKPTDGSGDLTFTRASTATRVNSDGLIETSPVNLFEQSESFNVTWATNAGATITSNSTIAPNGTTTADTLTAAALSSSGIYQVRSTVAGQVYTASLYVKNNSGATSVKYQEENSAAAILFNASTGVITGTLGTVINSSVENVGNGWYKIQFAYTSTNATNIFLIYSNLVVVNSFFIWGAQLNIGSTAKPYFPTTDRLNVPRIDYTGGGCGSLILESQRTNLVTYSEQIQNADWNVIGGDLVVTGNATTSPDGTQNAGAITLANSANRYFVHNLFSITGGVTYTYSVYMKSASGTLQINMGGVNGLVGVLKTVTTEWQRFTYTFTPATTYAEYFGFDNRGAGSSTSGTLYYWGAQVEAGSYVSSYVPTLASSVTRLADAASKTGISSLIGQTQGTLFFEYPNFNSDYNQGLIGIDDGSGNNRILFYSDSNNRITAQVRTNGVTQQPASYSVSGKVKVAIGYNSSSFVFYVNGTLRFTGTAVVFSNTMSVLTFNHVGVGGSITNQAIVFPTRLTNTQLESLTSL